MSSTPPPGGSTPPIVPPSTTAPTATTTTTAPPSSTTGATPTPTASFFPMPGSAGPGISAPYIAPLPSCLMPESFTGKSDFEDYLQQFSTAALLSGWHSATHDNRPHYFALRLRENALHFFTTLSPAQQTNFDLLVDAFRQNYTTNGDILKARLKAAKQQPTQDISAFLCDVRTLARRAYRDTPDMIDPMVLTCFIEGLSDKTLRWELRKAKPANADHALTLAMELNSFLEIENGSQQLSQPVNQIDSTPAITPSSEVWTEFVRSLRQELHREKPQSSGSSNFQRQSSGEFNRSRSRSNDSARSNQSVRFQSPQERGRQQYRSKDNNSQRRYRDDSPHPNLKQEKKRSSWNKKHCDKCKRNNHETKDCKACYNCLRVGHFSKECTFPKRSSLN